MIVDWIRNAKDPEKTGMILIHNGIVRGTSRDGKRVKGMELSFRKDKLDEVIKELIRAPGISDVKVWINQGTLKVGDDIMYVLVAGRTREEVIPVFNRLLERLKKEVVSEKEILATPL